MTDTHSPPRTRRAPNGASASVHIPLTPEERAHIDALAYREQRTTGNTARLLLLRGLKAFEERPDQPLASYECRPAQNCAGRNAL